MQLAFITALGVGGSTIIGVLFGILVLVVYIYFKKKKQIEI